MEKEMQEFEDTDAFGKEFSELDLENIDMENIDADGIDFGDMNEQEIDFAFEDLLNQENDDLSFKEDMNSLLNKEENESGVDHMSNDEGTEMSISGKQEETGTNDILADVENMEEKTEEVDLESLLSVENNNTDSDSAEKEFDMDHLLAGLDEDSANSQQQEADDLLSVSEDAGMNQEEEFDIDSLLSDASGNTDENQGQEFDMDDLLNDAEKEKISGLEEESFDMDDLLAGDDTAVQKEDEGTDDFSLDSLLGNGLGFENAEESTQSDGNSVEGDDLILNDIGDALDTSILEAMPDAEEMAAAEEKKEQKKGLFARLFGNVKDEKWEKEKALEAEKAEAKRLREEEKKKIEEAEEGEQELTKEEKKAAKKAEKEAKKAAKKEAKEQAKKEKEAKKEQEQDIAEVVEEDEGRINKVGASIVFGFFAVCAIGVIVGTNNFSYQQSVKNAMNLFNVKKYAQAYDEIRGVKVKKKDEEIYNKIKTVMYVDKQLNSYNNYYEIKLYPEALDSLLKGLNRYDKHLYEAKQLGIKSDFDYVKSEILNELGNTFEVSEQEAYDMIKIEDKEQYSEKVRKIANGEE